MLILGISSFDHDTSAVILRDGVIKIAIENEKLRSEICGIPRAAAQFCLESEGTDWGQLDFIAAATRPIRAWLRRSLLRARFAPITPLGFAYYQGKEGGLLARDLNNLRILRQTNGNREHIRSFEHHMCHAANSFFLSPFERALIITLDEDGDGWSGFVGVGQGSNILGLHKISFPHSLAWVYSLVTDLIGFSPRREEHKTQWLSLSGEPVFKDTFLQMLRGSSDPIPHLDYSFFSYGLVGRLPFGTKFYRHTGLTGYTMEKMSDCQRKALASSIQDACTDVVTKMAEYFGAAQKMHNFCFAGGLFQNPILVAALEKTFGMNQVFVPPAPGNAGTALGSALLAWHQLGNQTQRVTVSSPYSGPKFTGQDIKDVLDNCKLPYSLQTTEERKIQATVHLLEAGKIVGWFQGSCEFGPRALGNRSILASPWASYVKENLNDYIKHREWFRPFAISVPEEDCERYFEYSDLCRVMNSLGWVKAGGRILPQDFILPRDRLRLHVVERRSNPLFWQLLKRFGEHAPAPMLVNTSFSLFGEPLVLNPRDAVRIYSCSGIDALVIGNFVLSKAAPKVVVAAGTRK